MKKSELVMYLVLIDFLYDTTYGASLGLMATKFSLKAKEHGQETISMILWGGILILLLVKLILRLKKEWFFRNFGK